jgi:two-component sensor histidine kinase
MFDCHHILNAIQVIESLIHLYGSRASLEKYPDIIRNLSLKLRGMALIYREALDRGDLENIDLASCFARMLDCVCDLFPDNRIEFLIVGEGVTLPLDKAVSCSIIAGEAFHNVLSHAFPEGHRGDRHFDIEIVKDSEGRIEIDFSDNGVGLVKDLGLGEGDRVGLSLMRLLADQLGGGISLSMVDTRGLRLSIRF